MGAWVSFTISSAKFLRKRSSEYLVPASNYVTTSYVDDVVEALLLAGGHDEAIGQVFNVGGLRPISHLQLVQHLLEAAGLPNDWFDLVPFPPERKAIDVGSVYLDSTRIQQAIGWTPTTDLAEGLAQTFAYYREHKDAYWDAEMVCFATGRQLAGGEPIV